jgi:hypothetical protein
MFSKFFVSEEWLGVFAIATMLLFVLAFIIILVWVARLDKDQVEEQRNLPLKD